MVHNNTAVSYCMTVKLVFSVLEVSAVLTVRYFLIAGSVQ